MDSPYNFNNLSQAAKEAFFNGISKEISGEGDVLPSATPVNAVAAAATLTSTGSAPTDGNTVTIGDITYIFVDTLSTDPDVPYEVLIDTAAITLDNLKSAINATAGEGTTYGTGTVAHPDVTAGTNTDTTQVINVTVAGATELPVSTDESELSWDDTTTTGGVDGTIASAGQIYFDSGAIYIATADNTTAGTNWKKADLGALS